MDGQENLPLRLYMHWGCEGPETVVGEEEGKMSWDGDNRGASSRPVWQALRLSVGNEVWEVARAVSGP